MGISQGGVTILGCHIAAVQRFRFFAKAAVQEARGRCSGFGVPDCKSTTFSPLRKGSPTRSAIRNFGRGKEPGTALLPCSLAACSLAACCLAMHNLLPEALPAALQCATCFRSLAVRILLPAALQPAALQPAASQYSVLASSQRQCLNLIDIIHLIDSVNPLASVL